MDWDLVVAQACRHFGGTPDGWEDQLTIRRLKAQRKSLGDDPPPEFFLGSYFIARDWWNPSEVGAQPAGRGAPAELECDLPKYEP